MYLIFKHIKKVCALFVAVTLLLTMCSCGLKHELNNYSSEYSFQAENSNSKDLIKKREAVQTSYGFDNLSDESLEELYYLIDEQSGNLSSAEFIINRVYTNKDIYEALVAYKNDHPEKFWIKTSFSFYNENGSTYVQLFLNESTDNDKESFNKVVENIISNAPKNASDFEIEKYVYDYLIDNCEYDLTATESDEVIANENDAYGALVDKKAVCEGYSRAFQLLCNLLGLDCVNVTGDSDGRRHQWNSIKIEDAWYYVDVTWGDTDGEAEYLEYNYFNLTAEQLKKTHKTDITFKELSDGEYNSNSSYNVFVPECTSQKYNYYVYTCITLDDIYNSDDIKKSIAEAVKNGSAYYNLRISEELDYSLITDELITQGYMYEWMEDVNYINGYAPEIVPACKVYENSMHNVVTVFIEYI